MLQSHQISCRNLDVRREMSRNYWVESAVSRASAYGRSSGKGDDTLRDVVSPEMKWQLVEWQTHFVVTARWSQSDPPTRVVTPVDRCSYTVSCAVVLSTVTVQPPSRSYCWCRRREGIIGYTRVPGTFNCEIQKIIIKMFSSEIQHVTVSLI